MDFVKIGYIGGGSRFVVAFLHGLAAYADSLKALGIPILLALMDPNLPRAREMAQYAEIVAGQIGLPLRPVVTGESAAAVDGAHLVIYSAGVQERLNAFRARFGTLLGGDVEPDSCPSMAMEGIAHWEILEKLAEEIRCLAPNAIFCTLANPTDVLAAAVERRFGIRSIGVCVEVPQLRRWLAVHLRVRVEDIETDYIGVNHMGYVVRWTVNGEDATSLLRERLMRLMGSDEWDPWNDAFAHFFLATGYLRTSPYHHLPYRQDWDEEMQRRRRAFYGRYPMDWEEYPQKELMKALTDGRMIAEDDLDTPLNMLTPYPYPDVRHTLGGLVLGSAGGSSGPMPLQVRNGESNPNLSPDFWLELPTYIRNGELIPRTISSPLPTWILEQIGLFAYQRSLLADWFAGKDSEGLLKALLLLPGHFPLKGLLAFIQKLTNHVYT